MSRLRLAPSYGPTALRTPANALTLMRLAITPVVLGLILELRYDWPTFALWTLLCLTDGFDGFLARRQGTTRSGAFLDPLADKFLSLGGMGVLVVKGVFWWPLVAVMAVREVALTWYRSVLGRRGVSLPARRSAKVKTVAQQSAVGFTLMPWVGQHASWVGKGILVLAAVLTVVSGLQYLADARRAPSRPVDDW
jgi:CDP-diacylglycerol--glycerol-3-phosphate 3-phosphatidyltransferase